MARDPSIALYTALQALQHAIFCDRDDRRGARRHALAELLEVLVSEALVAHLAPDPTAGASHRGRPDDARREYQADDAAGDGAALGPVLAARVAGLLELNLRFR